jgi:hypothetical protein
MAVVSGRAPAVAVEIQHEVGLEPYLVKLFAAAAADSLAAVAARSRTCLHWQQFLTLFDTFMKSVRYGVLAAEGISHHLTFELADGSHLEYSGSDYQLVCPVQERMVKGFQHTSGAFDVYLKKHDVSSPRPPEGVSLQPVTVKLEQKWNFNYKKACRYSLVKCSVGRTRADACQAQEKYYWELEVTPSSSKYTLDNNQVNASKFLMKIDDLLGRYERRTSEDRS